METQQNFQSIVKESGIPSLQIKLVDSRRKAKDKGNSLNKD